MSVTADFSPAPPRTSSAATTQFVRAVAAAMPALLISFSAMVEPLLNLDMARGVYFGGVELEGESKTKLSLVVMPLFLFVALTLTALAPPRVPGRLLRVVAPGAALLVFACVSAVWGQAPVETLKLAAYQVILFGSLLLFVAVARDATQVARWVLLAFAVVMAVNLLAVVTRPAGLIGHQGIYFYKNTLGAAAGCAFLFGLFHLADARWRWRFVGGFTVFAALVCVLASQSKTALGLMLVGPALAVGLLVAARALRLGPFAATFAMGLCAAFAVVLVAAVLGASSDDVLNATWGDTTFTGRTFIWGFALDHWAQSPWIGNGYRGFWSLGQASPKHGSEIEFIRTIGSGHNGFVDMMLDLGVVGLALLVAFIASAYGAAGRLELRSIRHSLLYVSVVLFVVGRNAMESVILWSSFFDNLAFLLVAFLACYRDPASGSRASDPVTSRGA